MKQITRKLISLAMVVALSLTMCICTSGTAVYADGESSYSFPTYEEGVTVFPSFIQDGTAVKYYESQADYDAAAPLTGWAEIGGGNYYFIPSADESKGTMATGWYTLENHRYYFSTAENDTKGKMATGWRTISDHKYYFSTADDTKGQMKTGLVTISGSKYYFSKKSATLGQQLTGFVEIGDYTYYFLRYGDNAGKMKTGLALISGSRYYFLNSGRMYKGGWKTVGDYKYYFNKKTGKARTGWLSSTWYFTSKGHMVKGWKTINDKKYYFSKKTGKKFTGLHKIGSGKSALVCTFSSKGVLQRKLYASKKSICLTFDDGPAASTARVLNTLDKYNAKATFFMVGRQCSSYKKSCKRVTAEGHQVGCHTYTHTWLINLTPAGIRNEMKKGNAAIEKYTGQTPTVCRTPGGHNTATIRANIGMPNILWSVDTRDWEHHNPSMTLAKVKAGASDGGIILMHDLHSTTADAVPSVCKYLKSQGYQMVTIDEMCLLKGKTLKAGKVYYSF